MLTASVTLVDQVCSVFFISFFPRNDSILKYSYRIVKGSSINYVTPKEKGVRVRVIPVERCLTASVTLVDQVCAVLYFFLSQK